MTTLPLCRQPSPVKVDRVLPLVLASLVVAGALSSGALSSGAQASGASRNVSPDAVSRATTYNSHEGEVAWLSDGEVPPENPDARAFIWHTKGILAFEWEDVLPLERVRIRVGALDNDYQVRTYLGGRLDESGAVRDPEGERTAMLDDHSRTPGAWVEIDLPDGTLADNLELRTFGPTDFFEVQILVRDGEGTAVREIGWGEVKVILHAAASP